MHVDEMRRRKRADGHGLADGTGSQREGLKSTSGRVLRVLSVCRYGTRNVLGVMLRVLALKEWIESRDCVGFGFRRRYAATGEYDGSPSSNAASITRA